jgi:hypothetical protein
MTYAAATADTMDVRRQLVSDALHSVGSGTPSPITRWVREVSQPSAKVRKISLTNH